MNREVGCTYCDWEGEENELVDLNFCPECGSGDIVIIEADGAGWFARDFVEEVK